MSDLDDLGQILAEQTHKFSIERATAWEHVLRLHFKPKPAWMPYWLWRKIVNFVVVQSEEGLK